MYEDIVQLKMLSSDGKYYKTDVATTQQLFRLIQSIPSPKAEPFKLWMAQVAKAYHRKNNIYTLKKSNPTLNNPSLKGSKRKTI